MRWLNLLVVAALGGCLAGCKSAGGVQAKDNGEVFFEWRSGVTMGHRTATTQSESAIAIQGEVGGNPPPGGNP